MMLDEEKQIPNYRCDECKDCIKCKKSSKTLALSQREKVEQEAIQKSVRIDHEEKKVYVELPFTKDPEQHLKSVFKDDNNRKQA